MSCSEKKRVSFFFQFFYDKFFLGVISHIKRFPAWYLVPLIGYITTTGAISSDGSELNFIGNISFEGNNANTSGGKGNIEDAFPARRGA